MTATVSEAIHVPRPTWYRTPARNVESGGVSGERVDRANRSGGLRSALADGLALLALAWTIPFAILLVGTPVALTIALLLWISRLALNAF